MVKGEKNITLRFLKILLFVIPKLSDFMKYKNFNYCLESQKSVDSWKTESVNFGFPEVHFSKILNKIFGVWTFWTSLFQLQNNYFQDLP